MGEPTPESLVATIAVGQLEKFASAASGDLVEVVQRPAGAFTAILVDGQGSGPGAKALSGLIVGRAASLVRDGARDLAVLQSVHDFLLAYRNGLVSATIDLITVDPVAGHLRLARQAAAPAMVGNGKEFTPVVGVSGPIGRWQVEPAMTAQVPLVDGVMMLVTSDGIAHSGQRHGVAPLDLAAELAKADLARQSPDTVAAWVLALGRDRDAGRPGDDMSVVVVGVHTDGTGDRATTMRVSFPIVRRVGR